MEDRRSGTDYRLQPPPPVLFPLSFGSESVRVSFAIAKQQAGEGLQEGDDGDARERLPTAGGLAMSMTQEAREFRRWKACLAPMTARFLPECGES